MSLHACLTIWMKNMNHAITSMVWQLSVLMSHFCSHVLQLAREVLDVAAMMVKPGVTTEEIDHAVHLVRILHRGSGFLLKLINTFMSRLVTRTVWPSESFGCHSCLCMANLLAVLGTDGGRRNQQYLIGQSFRITDLDTKFSNTHFT